MKEIQLPPLKPVDDYTLGECQDDEEMDEIIRGMEELAARWKARLLPPGVPNIPTNVERRMRKLNKRIVILELGIRFFKSIHKDPNP